MGIFETFGDGEGKPVQEKTEKTNGSAKKTDRKSIPALFLPMTDIRVMA